MKLKPICKSPISWKGGNKAWINKLLIPLILISYIIPVFSSLFIDGPLTNGVGSDFRAFWSAGYIASTYGYEEVYDLTIMGEVQEFVVHASKESSSFLVVPVPNLPVFFILFQLFALIPPITSFIIWTVVTFLGTFLYLIFFFKRLKIPNADFLALLGLFSFQSFSNLYWGQINLLLMICIGEFIRNISLKHEIGAGLWLGGLILKPQLIILIAPFLLFQRKWRLLGGFSLTIFLVLIASLILGKPTGILAFVNTITKYSTGLPTNMPETMMNWRMIGERLSFSLSPSISWGFAALGMIATTIAAGLLWCKRIDTNAPGFLVVLTGTLAATMVVTWHSHIHMAMVLLPLILYLTKIELLPDRLMQWWIFFLPMIFLILIYPLQIMAVDTFNIQTLLPGLVFLIFNLVFLGWAWISIHSPVSEKKPK